MTGRASIAGAAFLSDAALREVLDAVEHGGGRARVVGGAVRNSLIGVPVTDIDIATDVTPETVSRRATEAGLKAVPTGFDHGTVTIVAHGRPFEVTTLRADVETDGRRALVAFTDDWSADAARRDFTMNAIYAERDGTLFDPMEGIGDALDRRVRFIGDPEARIREDYLRILRFFRFHAQYGRGALDDAGLAAARLLAPGMAQLSRERVGAEMRKILLAPGHLEAVAAMVEAGVLGEAIRRPSRPDRLVRLDGVAARAGRAADLELRLAALSDDADGVADDLRLSNRERRRMAAIVEWSRRIAVPDNEAGVRLAVYRAGNDVALAALLLAAAETKADISPGMQALACDWQPPRFPVRPADLVAEGFVPGPELGDELRRREAAWVAAGYPKVLS